MITLLASIAGFISSLIPEVVKFFKDKNDKKHELDILKMQIEITKQNIAGRLEEIKIFQDTAELKSLYATYNSGTKWVDALNGSVRPVLAYSFFALYSYLKYVQYSAALKMQAGFFVYPDILWTTDDQAVFAGIISFYFGQRTFNKLWKKK
jgi:hypothetical protein